MNNYASNIIVDFSDQLKLFKKSLQYLNLLSPLKLNEIGKGINELDEFLLHSQFQLLLLSTSYQDKHNNDSKTLSTEQIKIIENLYSPSGMTPIIAAASIELTNLKEIFLNLDTTSENPTEQLTESVKNFTRQYHKFEAIVNNISQQLLENNTYLELERAKNDLKEYMQATAVNKKIQNAIKKISTAQNIIFANQNIDMTMVANHLN